MIRETVSRVLNANVKLDGRLNDLLEKKFQCGMNSQHSTKHRQARIMPEMQQENYLSNGVIIIIKLDRS